jgi:3'-5' exoribonuclease
VSGVAVHLSPGARVHGLFLCTRKAIERTADGRALVSVTLPSGDVVVQARTLFRVGQLARAFERDHVVEVMGQVTSFGGQPQIQLSSIVRTSWPPPEDLLPAAKHDIDELDGFLEHLARAELGDTGYRAFLDDVLADRALRSAWRGAPCTISGHHAYRGGALEHTVAVAMLAVGVCDLHSALSKEVLVTAALVHELGAVAASAARRATPVNGPDPHACSRACRVGRAKRLVGRSPRRPRRLPRARPRARVRVLSH